MATSNQIEQSKLEETKRSNKVKEHETERSNREKEKQQWAGTFLKLAPTGKYQLNDKQWYLHNPQLAKDVGRLAFGKPLGTKDNMQELYLGTGNDSNSRAARGSVMSIRWIPSIGNSHEEETDAVNISSKNIYAFIRHANSGSRNYEANDLTMYFLALDSANIAIHWAARMYSLLLTAKSEDWTYPENFFRAEGLNYLDFIQHIADFRSRINKWIVRFNSFNVPAVFPLFKRHEWMVGGIWKDAAVKKSQQYVFTPACLYQIGLINTPYFGGLEPIPLNVEDNNIDTQSNLSYSTFCGYIDILFDRLIQSEDVGIMSGDILKAYGNEGCIRYEAIPDDYHVEAVWSEEVLSQISNLTLVGDMGSLLGAENLPQVGIAFMIQQDKDGRIWQGRGPSDDLSTVGVNRVSGITVAPRQTEGLFSASFVSSMDQAIVNMYKDDVDEGDVFVATRGISTYNEYLSIPSEGTSYVSREVTNCGTEVFLVAKIASQFYSATGRRTNIDYICYDRMRNPYDMFANVSGDLGLVSAQRLTLAQYDWAPRIRNYMYDVSGTPLTAHGGFLEYDNLESQNYYILSEENIRSLHDAACLSLYAVPVFKSSTAKKEG